MDRNSLQIKLKKESEVEGDFFCQILNSLVQKYEFKSTLGPERNKDLYFITYLENFLVCYEPRNFHFFKILHFLLQW